jgi:predicted acyltransferase (DUF342 family)
MEDQEEWLEGRCSLEFQEAEVWDRKLTDTIITSSIRITTIKTLVLEGNLQCTVVEASEHPCMIWSLKTSRTILLHLRTTIEGKLQQRIKCRTSPSSDSVTKIPQCLDIAELQWAVESKLRQTLGKTEMNINLDRQMKEGTD